MQILGTQRYKADMAHDKTARFNVGYELQEANYHQRRLQVQGASEFTWRAASPRNTLLGHLCPCGHLVCKKSNVDLSAVA